MKKIAITGHTKGIGKCLYETFSENGFEVIGFSRSNGYDISDSAVRNLILSQIKDFDIFINNAYVHYSQLELLKEVMTMWNGKDKVIINMNSKTRLMTNIPDYLKEYAADKQAQYDFIMKHTFKDLPQVINITLGLVDTDMASIFNSKKINPGELAEFILTILSIRDKISVQDILLEVPRLDWKNIQRVE